MAGGGYGDALIIGSIICVLLIVLYCLYFLFYLVLDLCINLDGGRRRRTALNYFKFFVPFWHVNLNPSPPSPDPIDRQPQLLQQLQQQQQQQQGHREQFREHQHSNSPEGGDVVVVVEMDKRFRFLTAEQIMERLKIPSRILTEEDVLALQSSSHSEKFQTRTDCEEGEGGDGIPLCSICVNEMKVGDRVPEINCPHVFHLDCLAQWVISSWNRRGEIECPNCRSVLGIAS